MSPTGSIVAAPYYCRLEAYHYFLEQLPSLHATDSLVRAAVGVSLHALDDVNPDRIVQRLEILGLRVRERARSGSDTAILANMHAVLFEEDGCAGNVDRA